MEYLHEGCWPYQVSPRHLRGPVDVRKIRKNAQGDPKDPQMMVHIPRPRVSRNNSALGWLFVLQPWNGTQGQSSFQTVLQLEVAERGLPIAIQSWARSGEVLLCGHQPVLSYVKQLPPEEAPCLSSQTQVKRQSKGSPSTRGCFWQTNPPHSIRIVFTNSDLSAWLWQHPLPSGMPGRGRRPCWRARCPCFGTAGRQEFIRSQSRRCRPGGTSHVLFMSLGGQQKAWVPGIGGQECWGEEREHSQGTGKDWGQGGAHK